MRTGRRTGPHSRGRGDAIARSRRHDLPSRHASARASPKRRRPLRVRVEAAVAACGHDATHGPVHRHPPRRRTACLRHGALQAWLEAQRARLRRPARRSNNSRAARATRPSSSSRRARAYVMRSKPGPAAKLLPSAHAIEREYRVMARAAPAAACRCREMLALCEDEAVIGRAFYVMEFVDGRVLWDQALPGMRQRRARRDLRRDEPRDRGAAQRRLQRRRPGRLRQAGQLLRAPDRPLEQAVPGVASPQPIDAMDRLMDWLPAHMPASARDDVEGVGRARRLPARQPGLPSDRAARAGGARLGAVHARPPAGRLQLPLHGLAHPAGRVPRHRRPGPCGARHSGRSRLRRALLRAHRPAHDPSATRAPTGISTSPTTCSASRRSCKASPSGSRTAPRRARRRAKPRPARARWPNWAGNSHNRV